MTKGMEPKDFLNLAKDLSRKDDEASSRTSIGRSYYAFFNVVTKFLHENGFAESLKKDASDHKTAYFYLNNCGIDEIRDLGSSLDDLRGQRNNADYCVWADNCSPKSATMAYLKAKTFVNQFEDYISQRKKRDKLIKGIRSYKAKTNS